MNEFTPTVQDADWYPAGDENLIQLEGLRRQREADIDHVMRQDHLELRAELTRRRPINPEYWDYEHPRSAEEYLANNPRRDRKRSRDLTMKIQKLLAGALLFFLWAVVLALLMG